VRLFPLAVAIAIATPGVAAPQAPPAPPVPPGAASAGGGSAAILFDSRVRFEGVSQDGLEDANALTARLRLGWRSQTVSGFTFLIEGEAVQALVDDFNDTIHGPPTQAVVADPDAAELNRLQVTWTGLPRTEVTLGRQRIVLGNARFVGNVGFRQNEQTFDAARVTTTALEPFTLTYAYIDRVHRVFGDDSPAGEWRSDSHILNVEAPTPVGRFTLYGYQLAFEDAPAQSSRTYGARLVGESVISGPWRATWTVELARQTDNHASNASFDLDYSLVSAGLVRGPFTMALARERLDGNGARAFQTPLATLHAFQGWADVFLTTPAAGLTDESIAAGYTWAEPPIGQAIAILGSWRDFSDAQDTVSYGQEFDVSARLTLDERWAFELKSAVFDGDGGFADRSKVWASLEYRF